MTTREVISHFSISKNGKTLHLHNSEKHIFCSVNTNAMTSYPLMFRNGTYAVSGKVGFVVLNGKPFIIVGDKYFTEKLFHVGLCQQYPLSSDGWQSWKLSPSAFEINQRFGIERQQNDKSLVLTALARTIDKLSKKEEVDPQLLKLCKEFRKLNSEKNKNEKTEG